KITLFLRRYHGEVIISALSLAGSIVFSALITLVFSTRDPYLLGFYTFGFLIVFLIVALIFNQKRLIDNRFRSVNQVLIDHFSYASRDNQFLRRRGHYALEKHVLAKVLAHKVLPRIVEKICNDVQVLTRLNIIIDSGTTLTPVFPELFASGIPIKKKDVKLYIYTNSMSGIEEIHKLGHSDSFALTERDISLIGGQPLSKYRATTGDV